MKRIIIPTDFSENALHAARYCHHIFRSEEVEWVLLHTFGADVYTSASTLGLRADTSAMDQHLKDSERKLNALKETLEEEFTEASYTYVTIARYDFLPDAINHLLNEKAAFLVALGTQGATGAKEFFLGSNAVRIMEKVTGAAVLAIPEKSPIVIPRKMALATTYTNLPVTHQLQVFKDLATMFKVEITMVHVSEEVRLNDEQKSHRNWLQDHLREFDPAIFTLDDRDAEPAIMEYIENTNTDIIGIISRKHSFFETLLKRSTLKDLGYHTRIPLIVMHHQ